MGSFLAWIPTARRSRENVAFLGGARRLIRVSTRSPKILQLSAQRLERWYPSDSARRQHPSHVRIVRRTADQHRRGGQHDSQQLRFFRPAPLDDRSLGQHHTAGLRRPRQHDRGPQRRRRYGYDAQGNQTLIRDPLGRETWFTFDARNHQLSRTLPLGFGDDGIRGTGDDPVEWTASSILPADMPFTERMTYDAPGRQHLHISFEGIVTEHVYSDTTGRLIEKRFFDNLLQYDNGAGNPGEVWTYTHDAFGRVTHVVASVRVAGTGFLEPTPSETTTYDYNTSGIRVSALTETDANGNGTVDGRLFTEFLNDANNHTGYSQLLRESHYALVDEASSLVRTIDYTFGHAEISQRTIETDDQGQVTADQTLIFGHGSVRLLTDLAAAAVQFYAYDAYGQMLAIWNAPGQLLSGGSGQYANAAMAATTLLYAGEPFDPRIGHQYLRARYYDPTTARFTRLDPFLGRLNDPLSLHKCLYVHADPVNGKETSMAQRLIFKRLSNDSM